MGRTSGRSHWDSFWRRDRPLREIYDNGGRLVEEISSIIEVEGSRILEVGAATARDTASLARMGASAVALDYSRAALALAREACSGTGAMLVCGDASALPFRDGVFDLVFHHLRSLPRTPGSPPLTAWSSRTSPRPSMSTPSSSTS
jgi:SAM-dependent methyltransferase